MIQCSFLYIEVEKYLSLYIYIYLSWTMILNGFL